jgi:hypothetical protein
VALEVATVLVLRAHYTMDLFAGLVTGLYAAHLAHRVSNALQPTAGDEAPRVTFVSPQ